MSVDDGFKDSPLGKIPSDWQVKDLNTITLKIIDGTHFTPTYVDYGVPFLRVTDIQTNEIDFDNVKRIPLQEYRQLTRRCQPEFGDILYSKNGTVGIVKVVNWHEDFSIFVSLCLIKPIKSIINTYYLAEILKSSVIKAQIRIRSKQMTVVNLHLEEIKKFLIPIPPLQEQKRIAEILDTIDEAIARTDALIRKLKQIKAGLLSDLLTRGLDENGELRDPQKHPEQFKDSPLGRIPSDWEIKTLDEGCLNVVDCPHTTPVFLNKGILVARTSNIRDGSFDESLASYVSKEEYSQRIARLEPRSGDLIFTREAPVGEAFVVSKGMRICLGQRTMLIRPIPEKLNPHYILAQIYSGAVRARINQLVGGTTNPHLNVSDVRSFLLPVPTLKEQEKISLILTAHNTRIQKEQAYLNKLKQQKKGLMQDLLTGKVRVNI